MKKLSTALLLTAFVTSATTLHALGGGVNSPENPTLVLSLAGFAGAALASVRARARRRK